MSSNLNKKMNPMELPKGLKIKGLSPLGYAEPNFDSLPGNFIYRGINRQNVNQRRREGWETIKVVNKDIASDMDHNQVLMRILPENRDIAIQRINYLTALRTRKMKNGKTVRTVNPLKNEIFTDIVE